MVYLEIRVTFNKVGETYLLLGIIVYNDFIKIYDFADKKNKSEENKSIFKVNIVFIRGAFGYYV